MAENPFDRARAVMHQVMALEEAKPFRLCVSLALSRNANGEVVEVDPGLVLGVQVSREKHEERPDPIEIRLFLDRAADPDWWTTTTAIHGFFRGEARGVRFFLPCDPDVQERVKNPFVAREVTE